jgi:hypothetical protein
MTARELLELAGQHPGWLLGLGLLPPAVAWLLGRVHLPGAGGTAPWRYFYSVLVYVACVPGMGAAVVTAYMLFFTHENLLDKNLLVYGLPIASMAATLPLIRRNVSFQEIPGFGRLSGLMTLIGVTFALLLAIRKTWIGLVFGGSLLTLAVLGAFVFGVLRWGAQALFRSAGEPPPRPPSFPGS